MSKQTQRKWYWYCVEYDINQGYKITSAEIFDDFFKTISAGNGGRIYVIFWWNQCWLLNVNPVSTSTACSVILWLNTLEQFPVKRFDSLHQYVYKPVQLYCVYWPVLNWKFVSKIPIRKYQPEVVGVGLKWGPSKLFWGYEGGRENIFKCKM